MVGSSVLAVLCFPWHAFCMCHVLGALGFVVFKTLTLTLTLTLYGLYISIKNLLVFLLCGLEDSSLSVYNANPICYPKPNANSIPKPTLPLPVPNPYPQPHLKPNLNPYPNTNPNP